MGGSIGNEDGELGLQIAPMVDVVFVLLLFFMAVAGARLKVGELSVSLPVREQVSRGPIQVPLVISISTDGQVSMNDFVYGNAADRELAMLREKLKSLADPTDQTIKDPVIIRPANDTRQQRVIDVLNACSAVKLTKISFS